VSHGSDGKSLPEVLYDFGNRLYVVAERDINASEDVTISYIHFTGASNQDCHSSEHYKW
jgi:hypothetical protein